MSLRVRSSSPPENSNASPSLRRGVIAALVLSSFTASLVLIAIIYYIYVRRRRRRSGYQNQRISHVGLSQPLPRNFSYQAHSDAAGPQEKDRIDSAKEQPFTGMILDIGHGSIQPVEDSNSNMSPDGISTTGVCGGRRDSSKSSSSGFARWKRGLSTLSGLTAMGLNFRPSDEKSPMSDDGDEHGNFNSVLGARVSRSLGRFGSNKSSGNGKGKGRLSSHDQSHDAESLSGLTSLSYVSNTAAYGHPPSYAASVSQSSGSNVSLQLQTAPRSIPRSSSSQDRLRIPPVFLPDHPSQSARLDRTTISGIHILGIGGGLSGIGAPISAHVALRGLSPRISRSKISDKGKRRSKGKGPERKREENKEGVMEKKKKRGLPQLPGEQQASSSAAHDIPLPVPIPTTGSPIRALPPIPTSQQTPGASQSQPSPLHPIPQPSSPQSAPESPSSPRVADTPSNNNSERRSKPHSSIGNAVGLGFPRGIQSFAEAAALAANMTTRGILVEGRGAGTASDGEPSEGAAKRLSTTSRVRFEDNPTDLSPSSGEARFRLSLPSGQLLPPIASDVSSAELNQDSSQSSDRVGTASFLDLSSQSSSPHSQRQFGAAKTDAGATTDTRHEVESGRIWSMQLPGRRDAPKGLKSDWSSTILHTSHTLSESSSSNSGYGSLQAQLSPVVPVPDVGVSDPQSNRHIFPFPLAIPPSPYMPEGFIGAEPSPSLMSASTNIPVFSFPTSRRGDHGQQPHELTRTNETAEVSKQITHDRGIPTDNNDTQDRHQISPHPGTTLEGVVLSPTDSFPHSISEIHFRTSVGADSDVDFEPGRLQHARYHSVRSRHRHRHQHQHQHPPLPSMPLSPQRFNPQQEQSQSQSQSQSQQGSGGTSSIVQKIFGGK